MCWKKFFPFMNRLDTNNAIFQQDNSIIHTSKIMKDWFKTKKNWSFELAHLISRFKPNRKFVRNFIKKHIQKQTSIENRETLESCIKQYWNEIPSETPRKLIISIQNKWVEVLKLKGNKCKYWILYDFAVKYKFSKLSYTYFHPQKRIFLKTFFGGKLL